ncbi:MAG: hypothetical protein BRD55_01495 [Bacteroidetes bacterium SW_9_63_38]|nr:MAG: hypothetical protein BRD55_01495 [Bacteroidetes bacterium SW_9_63_38]
MNAPLSRWMFVLFVGLLGLSEGLRAHAQPAPPPDAPEELRQFETDYSQSTIDLSTLRSGGPPKDGIPSIDDPSFVSVASARDWIDPKEPIIVIERDGAVRGYPLQILTHHEIVNDRIGDTPVAVTFCPLCYSSVAFRRTLDGEPVTFGVSGLLRHSDLVMYDRKTETLWQQLTGDAVVGDLAGQTLEVIPSQLISFQQFAENFPDADVLSRNTGYNRPYGQNPYAGYDNVDESPFLYDGPTDDRLPPKEKVITVSLDGTHKAYPHSVTTEKRVIHDTVGDRTLAVFHAPGAVSALDARRIANSKEDGSTGVFSRTVDGQTLTFIYDGDGRFKDENTGSTWTVTGRAVKGPLKGSQLKRIAHGNYFSFAWFAFRPETTIYSVDGSS